MTPALIFAIFEKVVLPELSRALSRRGDTPFPSEAELVTLMNQSAERVIAAGTKFLQDKGAL